jgi:hypothetical protein
MLFFRQIQHLLPRARAWRLTLVDKTLRKYLQGIAAWTESARDFIDLAYIDLFASETRELDEWEYQFGLVQAATALARREQLAGAWAATGGQSPRYLQDVVQAAGFDVWIHEWWYFTGPDRFTRNPRDYTDDPLLGTTQCGEALAQCGERNAVCNRFLANFPGYLVNVDLTQSAPPVVTSDPTRWPYFLYWGGETFGDIAEVPIARRAEFERLILKICPSHLWLVTMVTYV